MNTNIVQQRPYYIIHTYVRSTVGTYHRDVSINPERDQSSGTIRKYLLPTYLQYLPTHIFSITTYRMVPTYIPMVLNNQKKDQGTCKIRALVYFSDSTYTCSTRDRRNNSLPGSSSLLAKLGLLFQSSSLKDQGQGQGQGTLLAGSLTYGAQRDAAV